MSIEAISFVLNHQIGKGHGVRKLVLIGFANHADRYGYNARPSLQTVAEYADSDVKTVRRHVGWLIEHGYLREGDQQQVAHLDPRYRPIVYDVAISEQTIKEWADNPVEDGRRQQSVINGQKSTTDPRGDRLSGLPGGTDCPPRGDRLSAQGGQIGEGNRPIEPSQEPSLSVVQESIEAPAPRARTRQPKAKPEIPLPDGWAPTPEHRALAAKHGLDLELELVKFRGHAEANDRRQKSWNGAFTTWLGNAATYSRRSNGHREPAGESLGAWRLVTMRCGGCDERLQIDAVTNQPVSPHRCSQGATLPLS